MTPSELLGKADRALASAATLLRDGDTEGACNRAYYAMFNAARAALGPVAAPEEAGQGKTHSGLHAAFNQYLVKPRHVSQEIGASLRRAERLRQVSDYLGDPVDEAVTRDMLRQAAIFIAKIRSLT